jgi:hypothetical protein
MPKASPPPAAGTSAQQRPCPYATRRTRPQGCGDQPGLHRQHHPSSSEYAVAEEHPELAGTEIAEDIRGWIELLPT